MNSTILFLCPHAAAKSVIAAAYFNHLAQEQGLPFVGDAAGTDPSPAVAPAVVALLNDEGIDVSRHQPRRVSRDELAQAYQVISLGCDLPDLEIEPDLVEEWLDIPAPSQDLHGAQAAIRNYVDALVDQLKG